MKILIYSDNHFCTYSSIVRSRGDKYSKRLENQIATLNWIEELAVNENCNAVFCLGDFFDNTVLNSEEITALNDVKWNNLNHYFLVGNHETEMLNLKYASSNLFLNLYNFEVINKITLFDINNLTFVLLPYLKNSDEIYISEIIKSAPKQNKKLVLSHNDIKGINFGKFISTNGLEIDDIKNNCDLFINGHLHNFYKDKNLINIGNVTGQNFSEDAKLFNHNIIILDLDTLSYKIVENPFAFNFYKFSSFEELKNTELKHNSIISIRCNYSNLEEVKEYIANNSNIIEYKIVLDFDNCKIDNTKSVNTNLNIKDAFFTFIKENMSSDNIDIFNEELKEVCK